MTEKQILIILTLFALLSIGHRLHIHKHNLEGTPGSYLTHFGQRQKFKRSHVQMVVQIFHESDFYLNREGQV